MNFIAFLVDTIRIIGYIQINVIDLISVNIILNHESLELGESNIKKVIINQKNNAKGIINNANINNV